MDTFRSGETDNGQFTMAALGASAPRDGGTLGVDDVGGVITGLVVLSLNKWLK